MSLKKRIALGIGVIILGIILGAGGRYFVGFMVVLAGILISLNVDTWDNKALCYGLGMCSLIGGILKIFFPNLVYAPNIPSFSGGGIVFIIMGIFFIFQGLRKH